MPLSFHQSNQDQQGARAEQKGDRKQGRDVLLAVDVEELLCYGQQPVQVVMP
ncbi:hypothetical protein NITLEN_20320 [Nitrospira lenta]|uniref:Uncharacterized protein n=1 Tax=Nitrospira lenta TaxID=1436998 RepID=A0A330L5R8_9BACT|nr:hypothetical protein NITLEN_20320 [Nitrospira lenta]